jgi:hypothetical protein
LGEFSLANGVKVLGRDFPFFNEHPIFYVKTGATFLATEAAAGAFRDCCTGFWGRWIIQFLFFSLEIH